MRCIEITEARENGAKGSAIDLNNVHNVAILKSDRSIAVRYAVNGYSCFEPTEKRSTMKGLMRGEEQSQKTRPDAIVYSPPMREK